MLDLQRILRLGAVEAAPLLLGWQIVKSERQGQIRLKIVETEAYHELDAASHSYKWKTPRTQPMFEAGGTIYVYFTYGAHYCVNIVTGKKGRGEAVLLRAAEPLDGIDLMMQRRSVSDEIYIANGPGKLTQALGIADTSFSGMKLGKDTFWLEPPVEAIGAKNIIAAPRIGISQAKDMPWRFYIKNNRFVSKK